MDWVGVCITTIHDKSASSFKESHDRVPWYSILIHSTILVLHLLSMSKGIFLMNFPWLQSNVSNIRYNKLHCYSLKIVFR